MENSFIQYKIKFLHFVEVYLCFIDDELEFRMIVEGHFSEFVVHPTISKRRGGILVIFLENLLKCFHIEHAIIL